MPEAALRRATKQFRLHMEPTVSDMADMAEV